MAYIEYWSDDAVESYENLIVYFLQYSSQTKVQKFITRLDEVIELLRENPKIYEVAKRKDEIRRCVVIPEISLYYKLEKNQIFLLGFWDNRSDPEKLVL